MNRRAGEKTSRLRETEAGTPCPAIKKGRDMNNFDVGKPLLLLDGSFTALFITKTSYYPKALQRIESFQNYLLSVIPDAIPHVDVPPFYIRPVAICRPDFIMITRSRYDL